MSVEPTVNDKVGEMVEWKDVHLVEKHIRRHPLLSKRRLHHNNPTLLFNLILRLLISHLIRFIYVRKQDFATISHVKCFL